MGSSLSSETVGLLSSSSGMRTTPFVGGGLSYVIGCSVKKKPLCSLLITISLLLPIVWNSLPSSIFGSTWVSFSASSSSCYFTFSFS